MSRAYKTVAELLSVRSRWTRNALARTARGTACEPDHPQAVRWCLIGACYRVCGTNFRRIRGKIARLHKVLGTSPALFNDTATHAEALKQVKRARV